MAFTLSSSAFTAGAEIPKQHTCDGIDASPPLSWSGAPAGTKAFALIVDDPDAPASVAELARGVPADATLPSGTKQGMNDFRKT